MQIDKEIYSKETLIAFKCLKTKAHCLSRNDLKFTEDFVMAGGGYFYNRKTEEQAEIIFKRKIV